MLPIDTLRQEAEKAISTLPNNWKGKDGAHESFDFWYSGDIMSIKVRIGWSLNPGIIPHCHFVLLSPLERKAFFYEFGGRNEQRRVMEANLRANGYSIEERDLKWFNEPYKRSA